MIEVSESEDSQIVASLTDKTEKAIKSLTSSHTGKTPRFKLDDVATTPNFKLDMSRPTSSKLSANEDLKLNLNQDLKPPKAVQFTKQVHGSSPLLFKEIRVPEPVALSRVKRPPNRQ